MGGFFRAPRPEMASTARWLGFLGGEAAVTAAKIEQRRRFRGEPDLEDLGEEDAVRRAVRDAGDAAVEAGQRRFQDRRPGREPGPAPLAEARLADIDAGKAVRQILVGRA